jgi:prepilin peptidase CpaA
MSLPFFIGLIFPGLMVMSASMDFLTMTIPNAIPALLSLAYFGLAAAYLPPMAMFSDVSCGLTVLAITFAMFSMRWIGGGDAKLAAATALWMGWAALIDYGVAASIFGGVLTLGLLTARSAPLPALAARVPALGRLHDPKCGVPYGIALAAAGLLEFPHTLIWASIFARQ